MHERTRIANRPKAEQGLCQPVAKVTGPQRKCQGCWERGSEGGLDGGFSGGLGQKWAHRAPLSPCMPHGTRAARVHAVAARPITLGGMGKAIGGFCVFAWG